MKKILFVDHEEIGAVLFSYAKVINEANLGLKAYYVSYGMRNRVHDSNMYHYGETHYEWDYTGSGIKTIVTKLKPDTILASSLGGYTCYNADIRYNIWCYGSDIGEICFAITGYAVSTEDREAVYKYVHNLVDIENKDAFTESQSKTPQVISIRNAEKLTIVSRALPYLKKLRKNYELFQFPVINIYETLPKNHNERTTHKDKKKIFFSATRHLWGEDRKYMEGKKGNDILLQAIAIYKKITADTDFEIHFIEKGIDVNRTKKLSAGLKLADHVKWIPQMKREQLFENYKVATLCFGQFATRNFEFNAIEPMSCGIPTISWYGEIDKPPYTEVPFYPELPPVLNSQNPKVIADYMIELLGNEDKYNTLSRETYEWCQKYCSVEYAVECFLKLIEDSK